MTVSRRALLGIVGAVIARAITPWSWAARRAQVILGFDVGKRGAILSMARKNSKAALIGFASTRIDGTVTPLVHPGGEPVRAGDLIAGRFYTFDRAGVITESVDEEDR